MDEETPEQHSRTDTETQQKNGSGTTPKKSLRERLSGPQACLAVVGCGTLAALAVMGLVIGGLRLFTSIVSGDTEQQASQNIGGAPERGPVSTLEPGTFDLCESAQNVSAFDVYVDERLDGNESFIDTAEGDSEFDSRFREIKNECVWRVGSSGVLHMNYVAIADSPRGESSIGRADDIYETWKADASQGFDGIVDEEELGGVPSENFFIYGDLDNGDGAYTFISQVKSSVYEVSYIDESGHQDSSLTDFRGLIRDSSLDFQERLDRVVPDD
ncbi:hypothetical protein RIF23_18565 [Lipingzhangella sp. LS1_29]|uniref:DUF3558 domain-containing protein n=1 Tax=Lipingzhangella rawalii TaxID=2055835 RepID=A0ABU2HBC8_9ACTN|nr:hypothetical protein [Lipingzhangella rawalii]MDS1272297.1 hypothetical protein [Lipingzhangella rawalii]